MVNWRVTAGEASNGGDGDGAPFLVIFFGGGEGGRKNEMIFCHRGAQNEIDRGRVCV